MTAPAPDPNPRVPHIPGQAYRRPPRSLSAVLAWFRTDAGWVVGGTLVGLTVLGLILLPGMEEVGKLVLGLILVVGGGVAYFVPTLIAVWRKAPNTGSIAVINVFAGWLCGIGWVVALAMALADKRPGATPPPTPPAA